MTLTIIYEQALEDLEFDKFEVELVEVVRLLQVHRRLTRQGGS